MGKNQFWAVANGRKTGIFPSWEEAKEQVANFKNAVHKAFTSSELAETWLSANLQVPAAQDTQDVNRKRLRDGSAISQQDPTQDPNDSTTSKRNTEAGNVPAGQAQSHSGTQHPPSTCHNHTQDPI